MKRLALFILLVIVNLAISNFIVTSSADAALKDSFKSSLGITAAGTGHVGILKSENPGTIAGFVINALLGLVGVFFLLLMIYGGYTWMLARGNEAEVEKAKSIIQNSIIGLVIIFCAYGITMFFSRIVPPSS